jgi:hypothetical protein
MANETETLALHLVRAVYNATDGQPMQWRSLEGLDVPETNAAVRYAVTRGWMKVQGGDSVCLTDAGRRIVTPTTRSKAPSMQSELVARPAC